MQTIIIYTSIAHGNTEKVAKAIAEVLKADIRKTEEITPDTLLKYDLVGFGSGIYKGKHHQNIFDLLNKMPVSQGKKVFIFSTSGYGTTNFNDKLKKELIGKGFNVIGDFACKGLDTYGINKLYGGAAKGRPNQEDLQAAASFAKNLVL